MLSRITVRREVQKGQGEPGAFYLADAEDALKGLLNEYTGRVQLVYLDPPFATGQQFTMRMRVGKKDWTSSTGSLTLPAYDDDMDRDRYLEMMRNVLTGARELLTDRGVLFLHIDYRMHARLRLLMDEIFGEENLLNEIVWAYQTGGRARKHFSRKHDIILFYKKGKEYDFDIRNVAVKRADTRRNHMKRHVDADGRVYRSIRSGNKIYTYYDDEPAYPGDVWDDVSHMQQKDPQRTGYDTQKPLKLLERIVLCATKPGDLVCDLFAGSGTSLDAAWQNGRKFLGVDRSPASLYSIRRRLTGANASYVAPECEGAPEVQVSMEAGIAFYELRMERYELENGMSARAFQGLDALDSWAVGYLRDGAFVNMAEDMRTRQKPSLEGRLQLPVYEGDPVIRVADVLGRYFYYQISNIDSEATT